jgi:hypothetical protein
LLIKRILVLGIIILFLGLSFNPIQVSSTTLINHNEKPGEIFFGLKSHIDITWDENESLLPIMPNHGVRDLSLNISYWITWGIFGRITNHLLKNGVVDIIIEIVDMPEFCEASFLTNVTLLPFPDKQNLNESYINYIFITIDENAPAYEEFNITIQAKMDHEIKGPLGLITFLNSATKTVNITLIPDYWGCVKYKLPEGNIIETPPLIEKQLPIIVYNCGNGKTLIESEIISAPPDFIIYIEPEILILDVLENKTMYLKVIAPSNFSGIVTIHTKFTPSFLGRPELQGPPEIIIFSFYYFSS